MANGPHGSSEPAVEEYSPSLPDPPTDLRVLNRTSTAMLLAWSPDPRGEGGLYEVRYHPLLVLVGDQALNREIIVKT